MGDATWQVLDDSGIVHSFNKPNTPEKRDEILQAIYALRGQRISSDTGIGVIERDLSGIILFHTSYMLGVINPEVDMGSVEQVVRANPDVSGGLRAIDILSSGIVVPDNMAHFRMREISPCGGPFLKGKIMRYEAAIQELSGDPVNNPWVMRMALGIIPKK